MTGVLLPARVARAVRDATAADNAGLVELARSCPMRGDITMCVERAPDFFALSRLEGHRWRVGIAEDRGTVVGCVAASERLAYVNGAATRTAYVGDLKVHPAHRNRRRSLRTTIKRKMHSHLLLLQDRQEEAARASGNR